MSRTGDVNTMTAEEIEFQLQLGRAIADMLDPIARVLVLIAIAEREKWFGCAPEYEALLRQVRPALVKLGDVSRVTAELQAHNEAYVAAGEADTRH